MAAPAAGEAELPEFPGGAVVVVDAVRMATACRYGAQLLRPAVAGRVAGRRRIGTARTAYARAVANQVHTRLVPPSAKAGNTTLAGSRKMSGQLNVEDNTIAAAANATALTTNNPPVAGRSPRPALTDATSGRTAPEPVPCAASRVAASRAVMPAAKAKTVQQTRRSCGDQMETRSPPHWVRGSGSEQHGWRPGSLAAGGVAVISAVTPRVPAVDSLLGSRVGRGVLERPAIGVT